VSLAAYDQVRCFGGAGVNRTPVCQNHQPEGVYNNMNDTSIIPTATTTFTGLDFETALGAWLAAAGSGGSWAIRELEPLRWLLQLEENAGTNAFAFILAEADRRAAWIHGRRCGLTPSPRTVLSALVGKPDYQQDIPVDGYPALCWGGDSTETTLSKWVRGEWIVTISQRGMAGDDPALLNSGYESRCRAAAEVVAEQTAREAAKEEAAAMWAAKRQKEATAE